MKTLEIYNQLIKTIESSIASGEVNMVKESIGKIQNLTLVPNINIQAGFCHQKPYAFFIEPSKLFTKTKTELGDFLFVIKYIDNNEIIDNRALFFQAKYNKLRKPFSIELHQFHFYKQIHNIIFKFGKSVYKNLNYEPIEWKNISSNNDFGDYILLSENFALDLYTNEIALQYEHKKQGHFNFDLKLMCDCFHFHRHREMCCNSKSPLFDFLTPFGKGNKIEGSFKEFISLIYKKLEMIPDPPDEHKGFWDDSSSGGFGLIEITIDNTINID